MIRFLRLYVRCNLDWFLASKKIDQIDQIVLLMCAEPQSFNEMQAAGLMQDAFLNCGVNITASGTIYERDRTHKWISEMYRIYSEFNPTRSL